MKRFAYLSDVAFGFFVSFVCSLVLFRYLHLRFALAFVLAIVCGGLTALAVASVLAAKRKNLYLKKSDENLKEKLLLHLALLSDEGKTSLFQELLSTTDEPINRFGKLRIFNRREFFFLKFTLSPLSADEIPNLARLKTGKKKILLCSQIEEQALSLCARLGIEVRTGEWVYARFKERSALPEKYLGEGNAVQKPRSKAWFSKRNAKRFFTCGSLVLLLSRLTPYYVYYLLFGGALIVGAVVVRIFGYTEA